MRNKKTFLKEDMMPIPAITDSHCHLDLTAAEHGMTIGSLLEESRRQGITRILHISTNKESFLTVSPFCKDFPELLSLSLGLMPGESPESLNDKVIEIMEKKQICAIGEIGLDYYRHPERREQQRRLFSLQLELAIERSLPVVIHNRDADADLLAILERYPDVRGVVHCFTGGAEMANALVALGFLISFSGILSFGNAGRIREAAKGLPLSKILVETDAPYLSPVPLRGKPNLPWHIRHTLRFLAELRGESEEEVALATAKNARSLFGWS